MVVGDADFRCQKPFGSERCLHKVCFHSRSRRNSGSGRRLEVSSPCATPWKPCPLAHSSMRYADRPLGCNFGSNSCSDWIQELLVRQMTLVILIFPFTFTGRVVSQGPGQSEERVSEAIEVIGRWSWCRWPCWCSTSSGLPPELTLTGKGFKLKPRQASKASASTIVRRAEVASLG